MRFSAVFPAGAALCKVWGNCGSCIGIFPTYGSSLKNGTNIEKGYSESDAKTETERWVAIPGTSEHQLGLGVDINADGINSYGYEVYNWLAQNAYRYGFIYRYPENKVAITGIANEPWHYRYVGVNAATEIYKRGICLEEYLGETN